MHLKKTPSIMKHNGFLWVRIVASLELTLKRLGKLCLLLKVGKSEFKNEKMNLKMKKNEVENKKMNLKMKKMTLKMKKKCSWKQKNEFKNDKNNKFFLKK